MNLHTVALIKSLKDTIEHLGNENETLLVKLATALAALEACDEAMAYMSEYDIPIMLPDQVKEGIKKIKGDISNG